MVAISLYRGNLHRVPDVPRRWLMPTPTISLKDFKILLNRRSRALARLDSRAATASSNPNPDTIEKSGDEDDARENISPPESDPSKVTTEQEQDGTLKEGGGREEEANTDRKGLDGADGTVKLFDVSDAPREATCEVPESAANTVDANGNSQHEMAKETLGNLKAEETSNKVDALTDKDKRKKEVEDKLQILNAKKHNLVQVLKQILSAEEELKRRNSTQGIGNRPPLPLQVDATNDSGSLNRIATPRLGSDGNLGGEMEGVEADDASNHNIHSRHLLRMNSISPRSDSPHRRPALSAMPYSNHETYFIYNHKLACMDGKNDSFLTLREQAWLLPAVHPVLPPQDTTLQICPRSLYQEQITLPLPLPLQHQAARRRSEMPGYPVHGIRSLFAA